MISRQQLNKSPNKKSHKSKRKSSKMEREIKYGQTETKDEDGKMIPYYYIKEKENDDDPPPQYKSPLSSPRHKNKKELIKSSKNLGNSKQKNEIIHPIFNKISISEEIIEFNCSDFDDFYKSPLTDRTNIIFSKIKCLNIKNNNYVKLTFYFEIHNVFDVTNGGECIKTTLFKDEVIINITNRSSYISNPIINNDLTIDLKIKQNHEASCGRNNNEIIDFNFNRIIINTCYYSDKSSTNNYSYSYRYWDQKLNSNIISIENDFLYFPLRFDSKYNPAVHNEPYTSVYMLGAELNTLRYNFEKSKIICKVVKEVQ